MTDTTDLTFRTIFTSLRPPRLAFLLNRNDPDWMQSCLRIIERTTQIWGGWHSCIVPTDGKTISKPFWEILERFDPDYVYSYYKTIEDLKVFNPDEHNRFIEKQFRDYLEKYPETTDLVFARRQIEKQLDDLGLDPLEVKKELQDAILQRLNPFHYNEERAIAGHFVARSLSVGFPLTPVSSLVPNLTDVPKIIDLDFQVSLPVQLMLYSITGKLWPDYAKELRDQGVLIDTQRYEAHELHDFLADLLEGKKRPAFLGNLPRFLSMINCAVYDTIDRKSWLEPSVVIVGDSVEDFCLYYSLSRIKDNVYWLPNSLIRSYEKAMDSEDRSAFYRFEHEESLLTKLSYHLYQDIHYERPESKIVSMSLSLNESELLHVGKFLDKAKLVGMGNELQGRIEIIHDVRDLLTYSRRLYETHNVDHHYTEQFRRGESVDFIKTPKPESFKIVPPSGHFWISELRVSEYKLPQRSELALATLKHLPYSTEQVRVSRDGLAYFSPNIGYFGGDLNSTLVRPKLRLLEAFDLFSRVFEAEEFHISNSDKGNYHLHSVEKFGSLETIASFFQDAAHRKLFDRFLDEKDAKDGVGVCAHERRFLDFEAIKEILIDQGRTERLIDDLIPRKVFHRGFVFQCESCRNADWYAIEDIESTFTCSRCRTEQVYKKQHWKSPQEPQWYYKLDEIVYQGYRHNMHVPILTLDLLRREAKESFIYLPEVEVRKISESKKPEMELDLCCCVDGRIFIGQATREPNLATTVGKEQDRLNMHLMLAEKLGAKCVVLATFLPNWSSRTTDMANATFSDKRVNVRLLTFTQLIPESKSAGL